MLDAFSALDIRIGRIQRVERHEAARAPSYKLWIDFGSLGTKTSCGQFTALYSQEELVNRLVVCAVNLGTRRIAGFPSEVLVLGAKDHQARVVLLAVERPVAPGERVF